MQGRSRWLRAIVWGSGEIASAVAVALFRQHYAVVILEGSRPTTTRRRMAFSDAVFDGQTTLDGITAVRADELQAIRTLLDASQRIPLVVGCLDTLLGTVPCEFLIDARMRKRAWPPTIRGLAPLTIGIGPNFVAGEHVDVAIETEWGDELGSVIMAGATRPLRGEPRIIAGHARDRYVYAPIAGEFRTSSRIGDAVVAGEPIAVIDEATLLAPLTGVLRGLTRSGVPVDVGTKVIEVDPRGSGAVIDGIGERPAAIARGVLAAMQRTRWRVLTPDASDTLLQSG